MNKLDDTERMPNYLQRHKLKKVDGISTKALDFGEDLADTTYVRAPIRVNRAADKRQRERIPPMPRESVEKV